MSAWGGVIAEFGDHLPEACRRTPVTLLEGNTPLIPSVALSRRVNATVWFKFEGLNPTGSFKDRGMVTAMSAAKASGAVSCICASTGNTAASAAAYAARAGLTCYVVVPQGKVALGKLAGATVHGARILEISGNFDTALKMVRDVATRQPVALVNSVNPYRIEGQKTAAFELVRDLGGPPDVVVLPVGNAGNITAYWKGFQEYYSSGRITSRPRMIGVQAAGSAPIVRGQPVEDPQTLATAIRIGNPASWAGATAALEESHGSIHAVSDDDILAAHEFLARHEGLFAEPASVAPVAWLLNHGLEAGFTPQQNVVCILTGHGLKDPDTALRAARETTRVEGTVDALEEVLRA